MTATFQKIDYDIILKRLDETRNWLNNIKLKTDESRFSGILEQVNVICDYHANNKVQELVNNYNNEILWYSLLESTALLDIYEAFKDLKNHQIPRAKLAEILKGPFLPRDEDPATQNTHCRNTLFELQMAAKFINAGIEVVGFDDIDFIFEEHQFNAQCKRIHSIKRIEENVQKAYEQIQSRFKKNEKQRAIICISIDKLAEKDDKILKVKRARDIAPEMIRITREFIENYKKYWQNFIDIRLIATLVFFQAAAIIEEFNLLTRCHQMAIDPIAIPENLQSREYALILSMVKILQKATD
ncbi:MAG: hypothetical protein ACFFCW_19910 [Candidatus Hodarchaeota archaeon]